MDRDERKLLSWKYLRRAESKLAGKQTGVLSSVSSSVTLLERHRFKTHDILEMFPDEHGTPPCSSSGMPRSLRSRPSFVRCGLVRGDRTAPFSFILLREMIHEQRPRPKIGGVVRDLRVATPVSWGNSR